MNGTAITAFSAILLVGDACGASRGQAETAAPARFVDVAAEVGLGPDVIPETVARVCFADLTGDGWPDAVIDRHRVFLNRACDESPVGRRFHEVPPDETGLLAPKGSAVVVFADLDNDGHLDAIVAEFIDALNPNWNDHGQRTGWHRGNGDGTFGPRRTIDAAPPRPTSSIAIADVNRDGRLDLYIGNTYVQYGGGFEGHTNDLLLSDEGGAWSREALPEDEHEFTMEEDLGGRPTFGVMILANPVGEGAMLLELSYGRRWNRAWVRESRHNVWRDIAPEIGLDGDDIRHGRYPAWLKERAKTDPRFDRPDELPFRANGNTFDAAVGDVNDNGRFDLFMAEITHGWAGDSSDRSRFLFNTGERFVEDERYNVDRIPPAPEDEDAPHNWNHGDLFCEFADLDHSGRLDLILSSGDYPDDQRLRIFTVERASAPTEPNAGRGGPALLRDVTCEWAIDHDGSQQISLADIDGDGALDILVGQTFNRFTAEQREGRSPRLRLFHNRATEGRRSLTLRLEGDGVTANRDALGAIVTARVGEATMRRQLIGIGGHAGKQHDFIIHFGLGEADSVDEMTIHWPDAARTAQTFTDVPADRYRLRQHSELRANGTADERR